MAFTQHGRNVEVGVLDYLYLGYIIQNLDIERGSDRRTLMDESGNQVTDIFNNPGNKLTLNMVVEDSSDPMGLTMGDIVTVNSVVYVLAEPIKQARIQEGESTVTLILEKKDSMTYTP